MPLFLSEADLVTHLFGPAHRGVGEQLIARWRINRTFPKPVSGVQERYYLVPEVEEWILLFYGVRRGPPDAAPERFYDVGNAGEDWDAFHRKTGKTRRLGGTGASLAPTQGPLGGGVAAVNGTGKAGEVPARDEAVADRRHDTKPSKR